MGGDLPKLKTFIGESCSKLNIKDKTTKLKKLELLRSDALNKLQYSKDVKTVEKSVVNLSSKELTLNENKILQLGLNFAVPSKHHQELLIEAAINTEVAIQTVDTKNSTQSRCLMDDIRMGVARILRSEKNKPDKTIKDYGWIKKYISGLRNDNSIKILPADKGNVTVLVDTSWYDDKIKNLLNNSAYQQVLENPVPKVEKDLKKLCLGLMKFNKLSKEQYKFLTPSNCNVPRFYGLPKIHKEGTPLRPIVDFRGSSTYNLAKFLAKLLQPIVDQHELKLQNSYHFIDKIKGICIPKDYVMCSFDVVSLFTQVPVHNTTSYIKHRLSICDIWKNRTNLWIDDIMKLLHIAVSSNYFKWKEMLYWQIDGTPMGSPISPVFAEFCMQKLEEQLVLQHEAIFFWTRFVDDTFAIVKKDSLDSIMVTLNDYHPSLKFTCELEIENKLSFLDAQLIKKEDGTLLRSVYRKNTHSGRYLNFQSYHPMAHKISVVDALAFRSYIICDEENVEEDLSLVEQQLFVNGYPKSFIRKRFERMKERARNWTFGKKLDNEEDKDKPRFVFPYMGPLTSRLTHYIRSKVDCNFGYHPGMKLKEILCHYKENLASPERNGIYIISCSCETVYIGETRRTVTVRTNEHLNTQSPVMLHLEDNPDHVINVDSASLVEKESRTFHRKFKEHLYILKYPNNMNLNNGMTVSPIWEVTLLPMININRHRQNYRNEDRNEVFISNLNFVI